MSGAHVFIYMPAAPTRLNLRVTAAILWNY